MREDIYLNLTEQKLLWTSFPLKALKAPDECKSDKTVTSLASKVLLITHGRFLCIRWHHNNRLIEISTHHIVSRREGYCFRAYGCYLNRNIQLMKWNTATSPEPSLGSTFPPLLCLLIVIPCQPQYLLPVPRSLPPHPTKQHSKGKQVGREQWRKV